MRLRSLCLALAIMLPQSSYAVDRPGDQGAVQSRSLPAQSYRIAANSCRGRSGRIRPARS